MSLRMAALPLPLAERAANREPRAKEPVRRRRRHAAAGFDVELDAVADRAREAAVDR